MAWTLLAPESGSPVSQARQSELDLERCSASADASAREHRQLRLAKSNHLSRPLDWGMPLRGAPDIRTRSQTQTRGQQSKQASAG
eukprot:8760253-Pyramimonas_sp.AAC.1